MTNKQIHVCDLVPIK